MKSVYTVDTISEAPDNEFEKAFMEIIHPKLVSDPINAFVRNKAFVNFQPTAAQIVALKLVFRQPLDSVKLHEVYMESSGKKGAFELKKAMMTETDIFEYMANREYDPDKFLNVVINYLDLICGRRSGKSSLAAILSLFCAIKTNWRPFLSKTPTATVLVLSHTKEFSEEILAILRAIVENSPILHRLKDRTKKDSRSTFNLKVPFKTDHGIEYSPVTIMVGAASKRTTRGKAVCALLADECCFWGSEEGSAETDEDVFRAVRPALLQFGESGAMYKLSSPAIKQGVMYTEYEKWLNNDLPENYLVFKSPSWVWNSTLPEKEFAKEAQLDPVGFDTEFRANFVDSISNFILPEFVDLCTSRGVTFLPPEPSGEDVMYMAAIDAAFKGDRFTFSLVGSLKGKIKQYVMKAWEGSRKKPVQAFEVAEYIQKVCKQYGVGRVHADQFAFQPLREIFDKYGITLVENTFTNIFKQKIFFNLKKLIHNQNIELLEHHILIKEIKQLQVEQTSTGTIRIGHPISAHDDCVTSCAIASYLVTEKSNTAAIDNSDIAGVDYGIETDSHGRAFLAPSPEMLGDFMRSPVVDNSHLFEKDPVTGEIRRKDDDDFEDGNDGGADFTFF